MPAGVDPSKHRQHRWNDAVRNTWNARADDWDRMSAANAETSDRHAELERLQQQLKLSRGSLVLDAGCGTGQFAIAFAQRGIDVVAIDIAPNMIAHARNNAENAGVQIDWHIADALSVELAPETFAAVHARMSLQFALEPEAMLNRFRELLHRDGRLFASVPGDLSPIYQRSWRRHLLGADQQLNYMTPRELEQILTHLDWHIVDEWGSFGTTMGGTRNSLADFGHRYDELPLVRASSTAWGFVAEPVTT